MCKYIFVLTYNEHELWTKNYNKQFIEKYIVPNNFKFIVLDNGSQPQMKQWCEETDSIYYASEYNIGSSGGYNWIFKTAHSMNLDTALLMQADVEISNAEPLLITYNLTEEIGSTHFCIWPQILSEHWDLQRRKPWINKPIANLGNLVGFNPKAQFEKNCYFDENFVVTHFDDIEFLFWIKYNNLMDYVIVPSILNHHNQFMTSDNVFVLEGPNYVFKVHHASQSIEYSNTGEVSFHEKWKEFNKSYFDLITQRQSDYSVRLPYDGNRWVEFGYPYYPVLYEINRFLSQYPELNALGTEFWKIPNK